MSVATFDTLAAMRRLEAAGVDTAQAEAIIDTMRESAGELATKGDIAELRADLAKLGADLHRALWIQGTSIGAIVGVLVAIAASLKLF